MGDFQDYVKKDRKELLDEKQMHEIEGHVDNMYNVTSDKVYSADNDITMVYDMYGTTSYDERLKYYFQDHNMLEQKALKYTELGSANDHTLEEYATQHTNRSASKRKKRSREAAKLFRKAEAKEQALRARQERGEQLSRKKLYKLRSEIMELRLEGMQKTAIVKSTDENDEKYRDAKARLKCYTLLFDNARLLDNENDRKKELRALNKKINAAKSDMKRYGANRQATRQLDMDTVTTDDFMDNITEQTQHGEDAAYWERKEARRKKDLAAGHPEDYGLQPLEELNKTELGIKNPLFDQKAYKHFKVAIQQNQQFDHPDLQYYYNPKGEYRTMLDMSRLSGCMLRPVKYDENWKPISSIDVMNHKFNLEVAKLVKAIWTGDDENMTREEADQKLTIKMKEELVRVEKEGPRLPSPEDIKREFIDVYEKAKQEGKDLATVEIPFFEEMLKKPAAVCEFGARGLGEDGLMKFCPGVKEFLEENKKIEGYISAGGMLGKMLEVYTMTRYGFNLQTGGNANVIAKGSEKENQMAMPFYFDMYKGAYNIWNRGQSEENE